MLLLWFRSHASIGVLVNDAVADVLMTAPADAMCLVVPADAWPALSLDDLALRVPTDAIVLTIPQDAELTT